MNSENGRYRRMNPALTDMIIKLHECGYTEDFALAARGHGGQQTTSEDLLLAGCSVKVISQYYDHLLKKYIYLHTAETSWGTRGIVVSDAILTGNQSWTIRFDNYLPDMVHTEPSRLKTKPTQKFELI
jgi:hypothetical protein